MFNAICLHVICWRLKPLRSKPAGHLKKRGPRDSMTHYALNDTHNRSDLISWEVSFFFIFLPFFFFLKNHYIVDKKNECSALKSFGRSVNIVIFYEFVPPKCPKLSSNSIIPSLHVKGYNLFTNLILSPSLHFIFT